MIVNSRFFLFITGIFALVLLAGCETTSSSSAQAIETTESTDTMQTAPASRPGATAAPSASANAGASSQAGATGEPGTTVEEVVAGLDGELDASVAVFDGMILDERAKAEAISTAAFDEDADAGGEPATAEDLFEEGDLEEGIPGYGEFPESATDSTEAAGSEGASEQTGNADDDAAAATEGDLAAEGGGGRPAPGSAKGGIPEDIGDGNDDDIVARQIREAALREKDPALRDKLWDEYRKYKNQK